MNIFENTITKIKENLCQTLKAHLPQFDSFSLLEFPDYSNVGDSAIWLGETKFFIEIYGQIPSYIAPCANSILPAARMDLIIDGIPEGPIFLSGGGNFGDLWLSIHHFRKHLLKRTVGRPVIQLPQSLHFESAKELDETAKIISDHGQFHLFVRDHQSFAIAKRNFDCKVTLCPDMAFFLGPINPPIHHEGTDISCLIRTDKESIIATDEIDISNRKYNISINDWLEEKYKPRTRLIKSRKLTKLAKKCIPQRTYTRLEYDLLEKAAQNRLVRGLAVLSSGEFVITDRLHGHILSFLMGKPQAVLDNNYRKIFNYMDAWQTSTGSGVFQASSFVDALQTYDQYRHRGQMIF